MFQKTGFGLWRRTRDWEKAGGSFAAGSRLWLELGGDLVQVGGRGGAEGQPALGVDTVGGGTATNAALLGRCWGPVSGSPSEDLR